MPPLRANGGRVDPENINHNPTEAQKKSGVYAKDHLHWNGLSLTIENAKGSFRSGIGKDGKRWRTRLPAHYGYVKRTEGADGDHLDIFLGPHRKAPNVFVVDQKDAHTGRFDEHKALMGFGSAAQALNTYCKAFSDGCGKDRVGHLTTMPLALFKEWVKNHDTTKPLGMGA